MSTAAELKLYEIAGELEAITNRLIENGGELTPELEEAWEAMEGAFGEKAERTALAVQDLAGKADAAREESRRLRELAQSRQNAADRLKEYLRAQMARLEVDRVDADRATIWRQANGRPRITWTDAPEELPEAFRRVTVEVDTQLAYEEWTSGGGLPEGFRVERGEHLRIR